MIGWPPALVSVGPPRLLAGLENARRLDRVDHLTVHGSLPELRQNELVDLAENIDLRGRGGAGFPFAKKVQSVITSMEAKGGRCAVVVNGTEGEPSCLKDATLLTRAPHLVIDGALLAARALGAEEIAIGVTRTDVERSLRDAVAERSPDERWVRVTLLPERFVTGEGSALTSGLNGGNGLPSGRKIRSSDSGLSGLPTLLSNTETYAQLAVAARLGALGYRELGMPTEPGTTLLTVAGSWVVETPMGVPLPYVLKLCGLDPGQGVLVGGYHGKWLSPFAAHSSGISRESLKQFDAVLGAGAVLPLPEDTCPLGEVIRVAQWMADETAGQCGPCVLGLPAITESLRAVESGGGRAALEAVQNRVRTVRKRGACSHPDGTSHFVSSALAMFPEEFAEHAMGGGCGRSTTGVLPVHETVASRRPALAAPPPAAVEEEPKEKLLVDWTLCEGHGLCGDIIPEVLRLDADGYPGKASMPLPRRLRSQALRAVRRCPELALRIEQ